MNPHVEDSLTYSPITINLDLNYNEETMNQLMEMMPSETDNQLTGFGMLGFFLNAMQQVSNFQMVTYVEDEWGIFSLRALFRE